MCCAPNKFRRRGFTLLEVMLAVLVMALVAFAIYRFVEVDLQSIKISTDDTTQKGAVRALVGDAHQFNGKASDQVEWLTQAGNGLFTQDAAGPWRATLILRPVDKTNTLGLLRQLPDNSSTEENWIPLLTNVDAIEIRYFDQRLNVWLEKWSDADSRPSLVKVRIWRTDQTLPYEAVIELPPTRLPAS
jgi:prepilin-type N-terminal cleavage/methylation domain-containing protein